MKITTKRFGTEEEKKLLKEWDKKYDFTFNPKTKKEIFSIDNPPAYPSGIWHIGAASVYCMFDAIARSQRMLGKEVLFPFCLDKNGINIELTVQKKFGKSMFDYKREEFIKLCKKTINEYSSYVEETYKKSGSSADFKKYVYETDSPDYRAFSQSKFIEMYKKGLIVEDFRPNNYCPIFRTTIADAEVYYTEKETFLNYLKFKVKETGEELVISTTRPELLRACKLIVYNPGDKRYKHLNGKHAIVPLYNTEVEIKPDTYAKPEFGSGTLMVCSYGDSGDIDLFRKYKLDAVQAIGPDGLMTEAVGKYKGKKPVEARKEILEDLKQAKLLVKQEKTMHRTPICERSKAPIEFVALKELYVKQIEFLPKLKKLSKKLKLIPDKHRIILENWINSLTIDWAISRNRYYHTEIPLWYCNDCKEVLVPEPGKYYQPWKQKWPGKKCTKCGSTNICGEERVFDTWMDSSVSALYLSEKWLNGKVVTCRPQGIDIVRTWLYYSLLKSYLLNKKLPFEFAIIHGMGLDKHGKKMSKSIGNVIEPLPLIEKYGADAFRLWATSEATMGDNFRIDPEKIKGAGKTVTKLWNVSKFISGFKIIKAPKQLHATDKWILSELNKLMTECKKAYLENNLFLSSNKVREFIWNVFASQYLEMVKTRAYANDGSALYTLHEGLKVILKLIAPITPFVTDAVYSKVYDEKIHNLEFPEKFKVPNKTKFTQNLIDFNTLVWKKKKDAGLALNTEIKNIVIPKELRRFNDDLKKMHKLI